MTALVVDRQVVGDPYRRVADGAALPGHGAVLVSLSTWQEHRSTLLQRGAPVGVVLMSDEHPQAIAEAVGQLQLIALEFPCFGDGRAYSYARLIRDRYGFTGELRAVGEVLLEQLHYMERVGFNAFETDSDDPLTEFDVATRDFSVWYQPSADRRAWAARLRSGSLPAERPDPDEQQRQ
ncbi:MAG: DUF934 domain-containing protein [Gammaproteobacteria bacterium]